MNTKKIVIYALIAAIYTVLNLLLGPLSFGSFQIRLGELLMIFCIFDKKYIMPLTFGCFVTNLVGIMMGINTLPLDIIFGTLATLLTGYLMYKTKNILVKGKPLLSLLMPGIINGLVVGAELAAYLSNSNNFIYVFLTNGLWVFVGEFVSVFILGLILYKPFSNLLSIINNFE